jgi:hypothetical protein
VTITNRVSLKSVEAGITPIDDVPDAPTIGAATNVGTSRAYNNGSATVAYTAAATGGTATTFTATSTPGGFTATGASPITVTGLQSATSYTFAVSAANANGTLTSASSSSITATTVPQAPTIGTATAGNLTASVTFTAGATGGSAITGYTVTSSSGRTNTGASSPIVVTEVAAGTYTYTVTATNANGTSTASSASNSLTFGVPAAPTVSSFTDGGTGTTGTLAFSLNSANNSTITNVKWSTDGTNYTSAGTTTSPLSLTGLTAGSYTFYLKATNALGDSTAGTVSGTVITPTSFESIATITGSGQTSVTFSSIPQTYKSLQIRINAIGSTGGTNYTIYPNNDSSSIYRTHALDGNGSSATATNPFSKFDRIFIMRTLTMGTADNGVGAAIVDVIDYASTTKTKTFAYISGSNANSVTTGYAVVGSAVSLSTTAISSLVLSTNNGSSFQTGCSIALYGVK